MYGLRVEAQQPVRKPFEFLIREGESHLLGTHLLKKSVKSAVWDLSTGLLLNTI